MKELFIEIRIPNFEEIQQEFMTSIDHDYTESKVPYAFSPSTTYLTKHCPLLMEWLKPRLKLPMRVFRCYVTPPKQSVGIHIDMDYDTLPVPFGLNIPITGTKNTFHSYYATPLANLTIDRTKKYHMKRCTVPIDSSKLTHIAELEVVKPYIMNTSVLHGIRNDSNEHRVMLSIRWVTHPTKFRTIGEVMDTTDMFV